MEMPILPSVVHFTVLLFCYFQLMPPLVLQPKLDEDLPPIVDMDLGEFVEKYYALARMSSDCMTWNYGEHTELALTGTFEDMLLQKHRVRLIHGTNKIQPEEIDQTADIDSVIGWVFEGDTIPLLPGHSIFFYVLNNPDYTLKTSLHMDPYIFRDDEGNETGQVAHYHNIPNMYIGHIGGANVPTIIIRAFMPEMIRGKRTHGPSTCAPSIVKVFYDEALYCAVLEVLPRELHPNWPSCYIDDDWRSRRANGQVSHASHGVLQKYAQPLFQAIYRHINTKPELRCAKNMFLQFQIQNTKDATRHEPMVLMRELGLNLADYHPVNVESMGERQQNGSSNSSGDESDEGQAPDEDWTTPEMKAFMDNRSRAMSDAVRPLDILKFKPENWSFDIATTFRLTGPGSLLVRSDCLAHILSMVTGISVIKVTKMIEKGERGGFFMDEWAQTGIFGGARCTLRGPNKGPWSIGYVQIYLTDKTVTALKDKSSFAKHTTPQAICRNYEKVDEQHYQPLVEAFNHAACQDRPVEVRVESRVPFASAYDVHRRFPNEQIATWCTKHKSKHVWQWKLLRVESVAAVLQLLFDKITTVPRDKVLAPGTLIVALCWMSNATMNRPQAGEEYNTLLEKLSVYVKRDNRVLAARPLNAVFLHSLKVNPYPRVSHLRMLDMFTLAKCLGVLANSPHGEVTRLITQRGQLPPARATTHLQTNVNNNRDALNQPNPTVGLEAGAAINDEELLYVKVSRAPRMRTMLQDNDEETIAPEEATQIPIAPARVQYESEEEDMTEESGTNHAMLANIFRVFTAELIKKVPTIRGGPSWQKMDDTDAGTLRWADIKTGMTLPKVMVGWKQESDSGNWVESVDRLFPTLDEYDKKTQSNGKYLQGISQCSWFQDWIQILRDTSSVQDQESLVKFARNKLNREAAWLPKTASDRMWADRGSNRAPTFGTKLNNKNPPTFVFNPLKGLDIRKAGGADE
ncbi:hypothetical protein FRC11_005982 [Ceratobasidium sp. 423]|nr:hypothetical protein FRC11_005982 [Ceratobasidium sp. 423]